MKSGQEKKMIRLYEERLQLEVEKARIERDTARMVQNYVKKQIGSGESLWRMPDVKPGQN